VPTTVVVKAQNPTTVGPAQLTQSINILVSAARITQFDADPDIDENGDSIVNLTWKIESATSASLTSDGRNAAKGHRDRRDRGVGAHQCRADDRPQR